MPLLKKPIDQISVSKKKRGLLNFFYYPL